MKKVIKKEENKYVKKSNWIDILSYVWLTLGTLYIIYQIIRGILC